MSDHGKITEESRSVFDSPRAGRSDRIGSDLTAPPKPPASGGPLSVPCPRCKSQPGEPCFNYRGQEVDPHAGRKPPPETFLCPACLRTHKRHDEQCRKFRERRFAEQERERKRREAA